MNIMLFGGSFDPPHLGHLTIAQAIISSKIAQEVWYVPCFLHPFNKKVTLAKHRLKMISSILEENTKIENYELTQNEPSYSLKTLEALSKQYPQHTFSWVIGSDNLKDFHKWNRYKELLTKYSIYVYPRTGFPVISKYPEIKILSKVPKIPISSTQIREKVAAEKNISSYVLPAIQKYISKNKLYNQ